MKVISGVLKGRTIKGYDIEGTRPTMDRVKESLFAVIQTKVPNSEVLDLFAGSGNLGIEAISNGSRKAYLNDINRECIKKIKENVKNFSIEEKIEILNKKWEEALIYLKGIDAKLDIIFLDPPYKMECLNEVIESILKKDLLKEEGLIICEVSNLYLREFSNLEIIKNKKYGDKIIVIYQNK